MGRLTSQCLAAAVAAAIASAALPSRVAVAQQDEADRASDDARARELYLEGEGAYAAGDYERAAARFARAYELSERPALLFNLGNAYERMGEYDRAADALRRYLESPRARDREAVMMRIDRLEEAHRRRQEERSRQEAVDAGGDGDDEEPALTGEVDLGGPAGGGDAARATWWLGAGGAAVAGGLIFGLVSHSAGNRAAGLCSDFDGERLCPDSARSALSRERGFAIAADMTTVLGLSAAGVGGYLLWKQRRGEPERGLSIAPTALPGALGVGVRGEF
jgi:tetratricopeptide (TPR) repeat protein